MIEIIKNPNIDFVGKRKYAFMLSLVLVTLGIIAFVMILVGKANLGIDFAGGAMIWGSFQNPVSVNDIRSALNKEGFGDAEIQSMTGAGVAPNSFVIRIKGEGHALGDTLLADAITARIKRQFPENNFKVDSIDDIGGAVGKTLQKQTRMAVLLAMLGILVYIWIRFDFRFGVAATIATFHDVLAVLGIYFLLNKEITLLLITALLTLAGYSLTDTVVVFDRIRENLKQFRKRGDFASTVNMSINEVLSRTTITSLTTLLAILSILIFGGQVIRDFALAMFLGVLVGTYSSWFVASPIMVEWEKRSPRRFK
ncbi:MAG: protein translocase subunit SecF [candidate division Zixibacteria bacterium]|jgi:preprotein translocase SecF subunit|nr:protein translocase subunit SecF [candidate division Zixibacteria bacterium]